MGYDDPTTAQFRDRVRRGRADRRWTQAKLAQEMTQRGVETSWPAINKIEAGSRGVQIAEAVAIADAFGCSVDALMGRRARPAADRDLALQRLFESVADADRAVRTSVRHIGQALAEVSGIDRDGKLADLVTAVQTISDALDSARGELPRLGAMTAERRDPHRAVWVQLVTPEEANEFRRKQQNDTPERLRQQLNEKGSK
jgi:transcriptional regulator with XRE-family HTH domain